MNPQGWGRTDPRERPYAGDARAEVSDGAVKESRDHRGAVSAEAWEYFPARTTPKLTHRAGPPSGTKVKSLGSTERQFITASYTPRTAALTGFEPTGITVNSFAARSL